MSSDYSDYSEIQKSKVSEQFAFWSRKMLSELKAVYYTIEVHNFDLQEKTTKNNNNTLTAKNW